MSVTMLDLPAVTPVTLDDAHRHCRIDAGDDDAYVVGLIQAGTVLAQKWLGRALISQTIEMTLDGFATVPLPLRYPPVQSIASIKYDDPLGVETTLDAETYRLVDMPDAKLTLAWGVTGWPGVATGGDAVRVKYTAGYGDTPQSVPMPIRLAILLFVGHWYAHRETIVLGQTTAELPIAAEALISAYRIPVL